MRNYRNQLSPRPCINFVVTKGRKILDILLNALSREYGVLIMT